MLTLFAANAKAPDDFGVLPFIFLIAALAVGTVLAYRVYRDVKEEPADTSTDPDDLLGPLTEAYAAGQMSEEEYHRTRDSILRPGAVGAVPSLPIRPGSHAGERVPAPGDARTQPGMTSPDAQEPSNVPPRSAEPGGA